MSSVWRLFLIRINWFLIARLIAADRCFGVVSPEGCGVTNVDAVKSRGESVWSTHTHTQKNKSHVRTALSTTHQACCDNERRMKTRVSVSLWEKDPESVR